MARRMLGRYEVGAPLGRGGTATVHLARECSSGEVVALKVPNGHVASDPRFVAMCVDEARLAMQVRHDNVVSPIDTFVGPETIAIAFPYVHGESLAHLLREAARRSVLVPLGVVVAIVVQMLRGLAAAHQARGADGEVLGLVHRDVSPDNVLVGADGVARLIDFGIAKARARLQQTEEGGLKGKLSYMAPELLHGDHPSTASDLWSAGVVLWEALVGRRLFAAPTEGAVVERVLVGLIAPPSRARADVCPALDDIVMRALASEPQARFAGADEMADALGAALPAADTATVAAWVQRLAGARLQARMEQVEEMRRARVTWAHTALGLASGLVVGAFVVARVLFAHDAAGSVRIPAASATSASPATADVVAAAATADPVATVAVSTPAPSGLVAPSRSSVATKTKPAASGARTAAKTGRADCTVPYSLDAHGRRVYRDECL